ncbi:MAG: primosomal protein [Bacteroidota bacterium]
MPPCAAFFEYSMATFADIILPLSLPKPLTYQVPEHLDAYLQPGMRVVVPLGNSKKYAGIIIRIHHDSPSQYDAKHIESLIDEYPIVTEKQIRFWFWVSEYYLCNIGEVMLSALPPGLKFDEETTYIISEAAQPQSFKNKPVESAIIQFLAANGAHNWEQIVKHIKSPDTSSAIRHLIDVKVLIAQQEVKQRYKPKTIDIVLWDKLPIDPEQQKDILEDLHKKAKKQHDLLLHFILRQPSPSSTPLEKKELLIQSQCSISILNSLIEKGWVKVEKKKVDRLQDGLIQTASIPELAEFQQQAKIEIEQHWEKNPVVLLHGITGSGKTAVYAKIIEEKIAQGQQVLFLLPEIALTTQIVIRLKQYFGVRAGVYHSGHSGNERTETWSKVISHVPGENDIIIGARSALFLPFERLGLIIVDEEHDASYKQQDPAPRYNGRDASIVLAQLHGCPVLLGSATPSLESYRNAEIGRYGLVSMTERFGEAELPKIDLINLLEERKIQKVNGSLSEPLIHCIENTLEDHKQVILFQNRRGYTPQWQCQTCGWMAKCTRCDVSMTYHKLDHHLECHYCGYKTQTPKSCAVCKSPDVKMLGAGTEKIEEEIAAFFPKATIQRMDADTTRNKNSQADIVERVQSGEVDILVGTQMVTKGLDFPNVALVGVIHADRLLAFPDFRALERSFQILVQVAGRAGRSKELGHVLIQTTQPDHWLYPLIRENRYADFYKREIQERHQYAYPPFVRMIKLILKNKIENEVEATAKYLVEQLRGKLKEGIMGPEKPFVARINLQYIRVIHIKMGLGKQLMESKELIFQQVQNLKALPPHNKTRINIDVDPQ